MLVDFKNLKILNLDGVPVLEVHKSVANLLYRHATDLGLMEVAKCI